MNKNAQMSLSLTGWCYQILGPFLRAHTFPLLTLSQGALTEGTILPGQVEALIPPPHCTVL